MFDLTGKNALVTGASGGIGRAIALGLAENGASVVLSGRRKEALDAVAQEIAGKGGKAVVVTADLSSPEAAGSLIEDAEKALGATLDILVNNAGMNRDNLAMRMSRDEWEDVINVNLNAVFYLTQACIRGMMKRRYGRIINIGSIVGATGNPGQVNYSAAKAGMGGMTKSLAIEVASRNITVNMVAPGFIDTDMTAKLNDKQKEAILGKIPCAEMGKPNDIATGVCYLVSEEARYVTGQTLHINGGMAMF